MEYKKLFPELNNEYLEEISDDQLKDHIEDIIYEVIIDQDMTFDLNDIDRKIAVISPILFSIIFDSPFTTIRYSLPDLVALVEAITIKLAKLPMVNQEL